MEYGKDNIRAYTLALGNIQTLATYGQMTEDDRRKAAAEPSMKRWGNPVEVGKVAACVASDSFSFATGNTIRIDGGTVVSTETAVSNSIAENMDRFPYFSDDIFS